MVSRAEVLRLYRDLLRLGRAYPNYNIREYIGRVVKQDFRTNAHITESAEIEGLFSKGRTEMGNIRRMSIVQDLYGGGRKNVLEKM